jgi:hypothetical protein
MATVLQECTSEEQRSLVRFFMDKRTQCKGYLFAKKCFLFTVESACRVKRFHLGGKRFADDEEVRKWLRQQSKDLYAAGFDALVKRWINVGGGYVEK